MGTAGAEQLRQRLAQGLAARPVLREALRARGNEVLFHSETPRDKWCELLPRVMNTQAPSSGSTNTQMIAFPFS